MVAPRGERPLRAGGRSGPGREPALRVCLVQPIVPGYRIPVFDRLAERVHLSVWAGVRDEGSLPAFRGGRGFEVRPAPVRELGPFLWQPASLRAPSRAAFDVLVLGWNTRFLNLLPTLVRARRAGVGTVLWGHGYSKRESVPRRSLRNRLGRLADVTLFYSRPAAERYAAETGDGGRVFVAPNALDQGPIRAAREHWLATPGKLEAFRRANQLHPDRTILFAGRLEENKRVDLLIDAVDRLRRAGKEVRLVVIGDGSRRAALEARAARLGPGAVRFLGAVYDEFALAPWFMSAAVYAFPGAIGLGLLHAFGYGLPVVTHEDFWAHNPEIAALVPGENGLVFPRGNAEALASRLGALLDNPELRRRLGAGAAATVANGAEYTPERMVEGMELAIHEAARVAGARAR